MLRYSLGSAGAAERCLSPSRHRSTSRSATPRPTRWAVVHHANYVVWFELARTAPLRRAGFHYADIETMGYLLVVTGVEVRYRRRRATATPSRVDAGSSAWAAAASASPTRCAAATTLLATGATEHVWVDRATGKPCRTPEPLREPSRGWPAGERRAATLRRFYTRITSRRGSACYSAASRGRRREPDGLRALKPRDASRSDLPAGAPADAESS